MNRQILLCLSFAALAMAASAQELRELRASLGVIAEGLGISAELLRIREAAGEINQAERGRLLRDASERWRARTPSAQELDNLRTDRVRAAERLLAKAEARMPTARWPSDRPAADYAQRARLVADQTRLRLKYLVAAGADLVEAARPAAQLLGWTQSRTDGARVFDGLEEEVQASIEGMFAGVQAAVPAAAPPAPVAASTPPLEQTSLPQQAGADGRPALPVPLALRGMSAAEIARVFGGEWRQCETGQREVCGTWVWDPNVLVYRASWANGAESIVSIESLGGDGVVFFRGDHAGPSTGLLARYRARLSDARMEGAVEWSWQGTLGQGTWQASRAGAPTVTAPRPAGPAVAASRDTAPAAQVQYAYLGCWRWVDGQSAMEHREPFDARLTTAKCAAACQAKGFPYAGTIVAGECHCGSRYDGLRGMKPAPDAECNNACTGSVGEMCGGASRYSVYSMRPSSAGQPSPPVSAQRPAAEADTLVRPAYLGCWPMDGYSAMEHQEPFDKQLTNAKCAALCQAKGFPYAGTITAGNCHCGKRYDAYAQRVGKGASPDSECNNACTGNPGQMCGGASRYSVYATAPRPSEATPGRKPTDVFVDRKPTEDAAKFCRWIDAMDSSAPPGDPGRGISNARAHYDYAAGGGAARVPHFVGQRLETLRGCLSVPDFARLYGEVSARIAEYGRQFAGWRDAMDASAPPGDPGRGISNRDAHYSYAAGGGAARVPYFVGQRLETLLQRLPRDAYARLYADVSVLIAHYGRGAPSRPVTEAFVDRKGTAPAAPPASECDAACDRQCKSQGRSGGRATGVCLLAVPMGGGCSCN